MKIEIIFCSDYEEDGEKLDVHFTFLDLKYMTMMLTSSIERGSMGGTGGSRSGMPVSMMR